ncbi:cytochrome oxidase putative small subunit CydP [Massilia sp. 9096]|uniref:cytochrome oxidase putative small subunit CydP n=1 Tax=Massilia sp. 9096 TaxID=1500894 RepID=UPI00056AFF0F|nr:cytochrome oxidase putative small subunit CydP [Massilia sp. 9096]
MKHAPRGRLAWTLVVTVIVKCVVLYGLWAAFFSHPQARHMRLPDGELERHLFSISTLNNKQVQSCLHSTTS